ncbi:MAG TPA: exonuclease SbcCD subunit D [Chloroflexi bacterium]|nr:exonuclease SbcCD subunit D [Chloroflexota bacterium]|tara:strand:+ start:219 stop:1448 length:1230 start_codon:yes stop_codon:yes gene_type:complete
MGNIIRLLHFADVHVGMENYGRLDLDTGTSTRVRDFLDRMDEVIEYGINNKADIAIFAGDAFKTRDPNPTQQREFAKRLKFLSDHMPLLLLVGNHDLPGMASKASSVDIFQALDVPNVIVGNAPEARVVDTRSGPVFLAWMPYPMRNRLLAKDQHQGKSLHDLDLALQTSVVTIIQDLASQAMDYDMPRVLSSHLSVSEAKLGSERIVMLGKDVSIGKSVLNDPVWDYVALGHIHKHQDVNSGLYPGIVYSGSLERIDFGEEKDPKGFCWVELEREKTAWEFVKVDARPFLTIRVDVRDYEEPTTVVLSSISAHDVSGAVIRLIIHVKSQNMQLLRDNDIAEALSDAHSYTINKDVEHESRTRIGGVAAETLSAEELLERYLVDKGSTPERIKTLLKIANNIFQNDSKS